MEHVLVRFGEIGTKSRRTRRDMLRLLQVRIEERLDFEDVAATVEAIHGRHVIETREAERAARAVSELPGVVSTSPAIETEPTVEAIEGAIDEVGVGETFGVDANVVGDHEFSSQSLNETIGEAVLGSGDRTVDLDDPDTWIEIDVREAVAFVFTSRYQGPGGFPVGSQEPVAALVSGGIDSPVAAYDVMTRGCDVVPVYAYNKPVAAGDHLARFEAVMEKLRRFHSAKTWSYHLIDMEPVNERLMDVSGGRMLLHRIVIFRVSQRITEANGLAGIVTGEAIGQKSSQTSVNLCRTSEAVDVPVHRPLLTERKESITERARELGTFDLATVDSACKTIAPETPSPEMDRDRLEELAASIDLDALVDTAYASTTEVELE